jgi:hypothetical protein
VVVDDFDFMCVAVLEPDAPLPFAVVVERLKTVRRRSAQVIDPCRRIELRQPLRRACQDLR